MHIVYTWQLACRDLRMILNFSSSSTQRYAMMFPYHAALNKTAQPEAPSVMTVWIICIKASNCCFYTFFFWFLHQVVVHIISIWLKGLKGSCKYFKMLINTCWHGAFNISWDEMIKRNEKPGECCGILTHNIQNQELVMTFQDYKPTSLTSQSEELQKSL